MKASVATTAGLSAQRSLLKAVEELVMNMLAELTATNITKEEHPLTMHEHAQVAARGGSVARVAKEAFEEQTGKKVVTSLNMKQYLDAQQPKLGLEQDPQE